MISRKGAKEDAKRQKDFHFAPLRELCGFA